MTDTAEKATEPNAPQVVVGSNDQIRNVAMTVFGFVALFNLTGWLGIHAYQNRTIDVIGGLAFIIVAGMEFLAKRELESNQSQELTRQVVTAGMALPDRHATAGSDALTREDAMRFDAGTTINLSPGISISDAALRVIQTRRITVVQDGRVLVSVGELVQTSGN
jgi:hypothetical protein